MEKEVTKEFKLFTKKEILNTIFDIRQIKVKAVNSIK